MAALTLAVPAPLRACKLTVSASLFCAVKVIAAPPSLAVLALRLRVTMLLVWVMVSPARIVTSPRCVPPVPLLAKMPPKATVPVAVMLTWPPLPLALPSVSSVPSVVAVRAVALLLTVMLPAADAAVVPTDGPVRATREPARLMAPVLAAAFVTMTVPAAPPAAAVPEAIPPLALRAPALVLVILPVLLVTLMVPPLPPAKLVPLPLPPLACSWLAPKVTVPPLKVMLPALAPALVEPPPPEDSMVAPFVLRVPEPAALTMILPPAPLAAPVVVSAAVVTLPPLALFVTLMLPAAPPAPAPPAAPVLAVKLFSTIAPVELLTTVMEPAAPPAPSVAEPAPPLALKGVFPPMMPPTVVTLMTPPAPPA